MSLNIKDPQAHKLAQELARETGESMTAAVTQAIRERLEAVRRRKPDAMHAAIMAIGKRGESLDKGPYVDHAELLYDEKGLPK
ncbi:MAG TPA: type II toxin-antitoxin system VapB family antitoxin [Candidatus Polarisedimenticolia bacterium]|nr:type II toxin-antitoxin system VapB family antitoxin [Candidatus Polarisedimenticolia bacterium]